ncbi:DUF2812 domain-containing protein [Sedimentibacter hydroxybenzoicus DSM 7310]|uniref:DUF2812 domain-containing protein n=1 Tax=Sedimentibacter hydroxybenzoicus DSM 7310 TaxID=1123245 RepID=A0A974BJ47_SEDHY|nr:DUF2812 domain-containing protein [Sedimentibacter hydroxybenzoicus]NYB74133.1 DUF2812 domain-containing protein [Sedimentibacter hydroxybenzoicus DSM 7310]
MKIIQGVFVILKYKYFFLPYDEAEIEAIEGWLESMAAQGFKLARIKGSRFGFEESSTNKVRYCIYPTMDDASFDMPGWKYVGKLSLYFNVFISEDNNDTDKPDVDPICMEVALKKQVFKRRYRGILFFLLAALLLILFIRLNFSSGGFIKMLVDYDVLLPVGILAGFIGAVLSVFLYVVAHINRKKRINSPMERKKQPVVKTHRIFEWCLIAIIVISVFVIIVQLENAKRIETIPLDKYTFSIKLPLMEQISPNEWSAAEAIIHNSDLRSRYSVTEESRYVAPTILYVRQSVDTVQGISNVYEEPFRYGVNYYEMINEDLAVRYEEELRSNLDSDEMTNIYVDGFDSATYFLKGKTENIVLRAGNVVITAIYYGSGSLLDSVHQFSSAAPYIQ